jgi:Ran GTPase-activating protein (RanGAP) involved in mRNA processing and transport
LWRCELTDEVVAALFRSPWLNQLRLLELTWNPLTTRALDVLASSAALQHLHTLHIGGLASQVRTSLNGKGIGALASSPHLTRLDTLALTATGLGDPEMRLLADAFRLPNLRRLALRGNAIGPDGIEALASSPVLADLRFLDLCGNPIGDQGALALARSPHLEHIRELLLGWARIGKAGKAALKSRFGTRVRF